MKQSRIGILGATGAVGREMLRVIEEYELPVSRLRLLASRRSAGGEGQAAGSLRGSALSSGNRARGSPPAWRARPGAGRKTSRPRPPGVCR